MNDRVCCDNCGFDFADVGQPRCEECGGDLTTCHHSSAFHQEG